jgi:hypothetical protein
LSALSSDALSTPDEPAETNKKNTPHGTERERDFYAEEKYIEKVAARIGRQ